MYFRCQILINGISYEATDDLKNWDDFELAYKRASYDGVVRSFSTKFEFVNRSYSLLKEEFSKNYLSSNAGIAFYRRNNSWNWDKVFQCALDFSSYSDDGYTISINAIDDTLAAIIKAKRNIQYEYPVSELKSEILKYDRLKMQSKYQYVPYQTDNEKENQGEYDFDEASEFPAQMRQNLTFPLLYTIAETTKEAEKIAETEDVYSLFPDKENVSSRNYIFKNISKDQDIKIKVSYDFRVTSLNGKQVGMFLLVWRPDGNGGSETVDYRQLFPPLSATPIKGTSTLSVPHGCYFVCCFQKNSAWDELKVRISDFKTFSISFDTVGVPVNINVLSLTTVAEKLLESMTDSSDYSVEINNYVPGGITRSRLSSCFIMPAESARNLPNAKLYTSYKKFCEFMESEFGYVPVIEGNKVTFAHRYALFDDYVVKDLSDKINDYEYSVNSSLIYTSVKVGYDKQDYDSINGRDEFRFTNEFSTGLKLTDNTLSFISPYRADAYGIEFLVQKRGEDTTDNDSDNDVFIVGCKFATSAENGNLLLDRPYSTSQLSGLISPDTMFNVEYSPRFMLEANKQYIGSCTNMLKFTSSDGNSDVSIDGVKETDDFPIEGRLFTVGEVDVETSEVDIPSNLSGLISFDHNGETVSGYIKEVKINIGKTESTKYSLIVKEIKS